MSSSGLEDVLAKARENLASGRVTSEAGVQASIIGPIWGTLGWDVADPAQWQVEYPVDVEGGRGRVDVALFGLNDKPLVFVEVKRPGVLNPKAEDQLFRYANNKGVPLLVLTDGDTWDLYLSMAAGEPAERRFVHLTLTELDDLGRVAQELRKFIEREEVLPGRSDDAAKTRLKQVKDRRIGKSGLESAWATLLREPDDMLRDLLIERVEQEVGARPTTDDAERFLRGEAAARTGGPSRPVAPDGGPVAPPHNPEPSPADPPKQKRLRGFEFRGTQYTAPNAAAVLALLADALAAVDSAFLQRWADSGKGRKLPRAIRAGDALLVDPKRSDWYTRLPEHTDWYVFTSVNQGRKLVLIQDMAGVAGLRRDRDVLPLLR